VGAQGRVRARHHHDPGLALLHPRRYRSLMYSLAIEIPYWGQSLLRVLGGLVAVLLPAGTIVYVFLFKMMSFMQSRLGPMEAGPYGSLQLIAEVGKWLQKEDIAPEKADVRIFKMAPIIVLLSTFLLVVVVPFGPDAYFTNFSAGIFYALAVGSISVIGILIAGWASANKYSLLGGLRAAGQLIAYELPMVLAVVGVVIQAGSMNLQDIVVAQNTGEIFGWGGVGNPYVITQFVGFVIFMIAVQAELTQAPFDMPIAESELVSGYMTEYSGFRFLMFFIGEFATAGVFAFIASVLFLGGWGVPFGWFGWESLDQVSNWMNIGGPLIMFTKMMVLTFIIMWVRFSYPRFREDQLQRFAWKVLIPVSLANIVVTAILKVAF
jgi:NADH-quinone oxidoreductase subunit H